MEPVEFAIQTLGVAQQNLEKSVQDLNAYELTWRPGLESNPIGFLTWHLSRGEDAMINSLMRGGKPQVWETGKWGEKLGLAPESSNTGNSYTVEQVACFACPPATPLLDYHRSVRANTIVYLKSVTPADLAQKVPFFGGSEVPRSFVLSIVLIEVAQHYGQIAYIRGMLKGLNK
jgi:hypothetical protein